MLRASLLLLLVLQLLLQFLDLLLEEVSFVLPIDSLFLDIKKKNPNMNTKMMNQACLVRKHILTSAGDLSQLLSNINRVRIQVI